MEFDIRVGKLEAALNYYWSLISTTALGQNKRFLELVFTLEDAVAFIHEGPIDSLEEYFKEAESTVQLIEREIEIEKGKAGAESETGPKGEGPLR